MPTYEFICLKCNKEFSVVLSVNEREKGEAKCPDCGERDLKQVMSPFISKTSRKS